MLELVYNYFRDYDPSIGRYIESDPIGLAGGVNTYGYAYQNPITHYDPDGRFVFLLGAPALAGGGTGAAGGLGGAALLNLGLGLGTAWALNHEKPERSPQDEAQAQAEHDWMKTQCDTPPPPSGDFCTDLKRQIQRKEMCIMLRGQWDSRWAPNRHDGEISRLQKELRDLKQIERRECDNDCPK